MILKELGKIKTRLVTADEFSAGERILSRPAELALEDTMENMLWIGESKETLDRVHTLKEVIKEVNIVRREDICQAAEIMFKKIK